LATTDHPIPTPAAPEAVNLHLAGGRWEASCPACGYVLAWATEQDVLEVLAARATICPICQGGTAA
jgi:hypothetical protein